MLSEAKCRRKLEQKGTTLSTCLTLGPGKHRQRLVADSGDQHRFVGSQGRQAGRCSSDPRCSKQCSVGVSAAVRMTNHNVWIVSEVVNSAMVVCRLQVVSGVLGLARGLDKNIQQTICMDDNSYKQNQI